MSSNHKICRVCRLPKPAYYVLASGICHDCIEPTSLADIGVTFTAGRNRGRRAPQQRSDYDLDAKPGHGSAPVRR